MLFEIYIPYRGGGTGAVEAAVEHARAVRAEELGGGELLGHLAPAAALLPEHGGHLVTDDGEIYFV